MMTRTYKVGTGMTYRNKTSDAFLMRDSFLFKCIISHLLDCWVNCISRFTCFPFMNQAESHAIGFRHDG